MCQLKRKKDIVSFVSAQERVRINDIAEHFGISTMTVRRDLYELEKQGLLSVNRGVAVISTGTGVELSSSLRADRMYKEKVRIGKAAAAYVTDGNTVFLDCGTTVKELAFELMGKKNITVISNSLLVINTLSACENIRLIAAPGTFHHTAMNFLDVTTFTYLSKVFVDVCFFGTDAVMPNIGVAVPNISDCEIKKLLCSRSKQRVVLADSSKVGREAMYTFADFEQLNVLVTDTRCAKEAAEQMRTRDVNVLMV